MVATPSVWVTFSRVWRGISIVNASASKVHPSTFNNEFQVGATTSTEGVAELGIATDGGTVELREEESRRTIVLAMSIF